jgi:hypothetical protein
MHNFNNTNIVIIVFVSMKEAMIFNIRQLLVNKCMYLLAIISPKESKYWVTRISFALLYG